MTLTRVNIRTAVNAAQIRRERRAGRDVIIVPSATLPDNVVMNGVRYPAEEIERSFTSLNGTPAPLGHPSMDGAFLSASDPQGMVRGFIGAWNENARREGGRVLLDKVIDVEYANNLPGGRAVLEAIDKGDPIHTSTGLYALIDNEHTAIGSERVARDIVFDHDAILLGEAGAATPEQGVGMLVNAKAPNGDAVEVINSAIEDAERELDWAVDSVIRAAERIERLPLLDKLKSAILSLIRGGQSNVTPPEDKETEQMAVTDEQFQALSEQVKTLSESLPETIANAVAAAVKPLSDQTEALTNAAKAKDDAELADLRAEIVKANLMDETAAGELTLNAARALAPKAKPGKAYALNGAMPDGKAPEYDLPE